MGRHSASRPHSPARKARLALLALLLGMAGMAGCDASATADGTADHSLHSEVEPVGHPAGDHGNPQGDPAEADHGAAHQAVAHRSLDAAEASGYSIYHVESTWTDQTGAHRRLASLAGRPVVAAMLYTSCAYACPRIMLDMKRIEGELGGDADDVAFVVVSIDPERDTPERLAEFAAGSRLDPDRWTLLTADEGDILELAALLGVQYRQTEPGEWVHSNLITVLDQEGVVTHRQLGLGTDPTKTLEILRREMSPS